jgi:hypothetical protein
VIATKPSVGFGVSLAATGWGVIVGVVVSVGAGNINVIGGKGIRVAVDTGVGVSEDVGVTVGVLGVLEAVLVPTS